MDARTNRTRDSRRRFLAGLRLVRQEEVGDLEEWAKIKGNDSVVLENFIGKPVGLHGKRWYREDLGSDFIEVSGLEPVRIRQ